MVRRGQEPHQIDRISINLDLPPTIRNLKTELLKMKKELPAEQRARSSIRYIRQWPYVELRIADNPTLRPQTSPKSIVQSLIGLDPLFKFSTVTDQWSLNILYPSALSIVVSTNGFATILVWGCRPVASNVRLVRPRSCGTMRIIYAKINHSESARF